MPENIQEISGTFNSRKWYDGIIPSVLRILISTALFISIYIYFCGPVVLKGTDEFRMRHYEPFAFTAIILWLVHLIYVAVRRKVREESSDYFSSLAEVFGRNTLIGSATIIFISSIIMHKSLSFKPVPTRYFLLDDSLMTLMPPIDFALSKLTAIALVYFVFKLTEKILNRKTALFSVLLIATFQFNNNNSGAFTIETAYFALCASILYFLLYCREGTAIWGFPLLAFAFILHPAGYALIPVVFVFIVTGGKPLSFKLNVFAVLTAISIILSVAWYLSMRTPIMHLARESRGWTGYTFTEFYPLLKNTADNRIILFLAIGGLVAFIVGIFRRNMQKQQGIVIPVLVIFMTGIWWWTERNTFSLNALAAIMPGALILGAEAFSCISNARFLTKTLFDRNVMAILIIMIFASIMFEYKFENSITSASDYSIFEISEQTNLRNIVLDDEASSGYSLSFLKSMPSIIVFKINNYVLPAEYEMRFKLKITDGDFIDGVCSAGKVTIFAVKQGKKIKELNLEIPEHAQDRYNEFIIPFKAKKMTMLQFAIRTSGTANINLDSLRLTREKSPENEPD